MTRAHTMPTRFLDAELRPVRLRDAVMPLVFACIMTAVASGWALVFHLPASTMAPVFLPAFLGGIMSQMGLSLLKSPRAALATFPVLALVYFVGSTIAARLG